ncbi:MAG: DUF2087 domain-containing protein [Ilumatobacter sp.]|uniref:DUF2087 domain-containing protein n=1 Tax=Ilumatobacter sp. TaxID=1967498 RepID=UPI00261D5DCC|nr:DUF2087 domain-containing protein [Ilumatobacter sp.]MDJ0770239.1 DUF2087 domain-containing protein [Ilumatobacter sp.]
MSPDPKKLTTLLLDVDRLAVAGALAVAGQTTDELAERTGLDRRVLLAAVGDLRAAGIVADEGGTYVLDRAALREAARRAADLDIPMDPVIGFGMTADEQLVLERYFSGRVLDDIPAQRAKRLVVLQRLALEFDIGRRYVEPDVNEILGAFNPDWSSLRRYLVDEGFLDRDHADGQNVYWRSGGRVTDLPPA